MNKNNNTLQLIKNNILFKGLSDTELSEIAASTTTKSFKQNEYIINEEENCNQEFYIIISGEVEISKQTDDRNNKPQVIKEVSTGESLGESVLLENKKRTASAISLAETQLLVIPLAVTSKYPKIIRNLANGLNQRLADTNLISAKALRQKIILLNMQIETGRFLILIISILAIYSYLTSFIINVMEHLYSRTIIGFPMMLILISPAIYLIKKSHYPLSFFGLSSKNWKWHILESTLWSIPCILLIFAVKWLYINYANPTENLFDGLMLTTKPSDYSYMGIIIIAYMIMVPLQELAVRGTTQSCLQEFLPGKNSTLLAIFVSNLIFGATHLHLGIKFALTVYIVGMYWGILYAYQKTLVGVTFSHAIVGFIAFWFIGLDFLYS